MKIVLLFIVWFMLVLTGAEAGDVTGEVMLKSQAAERKKNTNPNRKDTLKKYLLKEMKRALSGGEGGPPPNEAVDERNFAVLYLSSDKDGAKLSRTPTTVEITQEKRQFFDHVTVAPLGSKVVFTNKDKFYHHIYCPDSSKLNVPEHRGEISRTPDRVGKYELFCDIHPVMNAYLFVVPNDKYAIAKGGKFTIKGVPAGNYVLKAWHPRLPETSCQVTVPATGTAKADVTL